MANKRVNIPTLDGGEFPDVETRLLKPNQVKHAVNMEIKKAGVLSKRKGTAEWENNLNGILDTNITGTILDFWLWFPNNLPEFIDDDYDYCVLVYYVNDSSEHKLSLLYMMDNGEFSTWISQQIVTDNNGNLVCAYEGTAEQDNDTVLEDTSDPTESFPSALIGTLVYNITKQSYGKITSVTATTITVGQMYALDGASSSWEVGDEYKVFATLDYVDPITLGAKPRLFVGADRVLIADGINRNQYIQIDKDGAISNGTLGIPAPLNKIFIDPIETWDDTMFAADTEEPLGECGLYQYTYTAVDVNGNESNPAPISDTFDLQFFKTDEEGVTERYIDYIDLKYLVIPDCNEEIESFNIYRRKLKYSEGTDIQVFKYATNFDVEDETLSPVTANSFRDRIPNDAGNTVSYENDMSPVSKDICEIAGLKFAGNNKTKLTFPFEFQYFAPIEITNSDDETYVDAIVRLRLYDTASGNDNAIDEFTVTDFVQNHLTFGDRIINSRHIRIYDTDLTTPIEVVFNGDWDSGNWIDIYIKIPELLGNSTHKIYLCWVHDMDDYAGVEGLYNFHYVGSSFMSTVGLYYGRFWSREKNWLDQTVFPKNVQVTDNTIAVMHDGDITDYTNIDTTAINKKNTNKNFGRLLNTADPYWVDPPIAKLAFNTSNILPTSCFASPSIIDPPWGYEYSTGIDIDDISCPKQGYVSGWVQIFNLDTTIVEPFITDFLGLQFEGDENDDRFSLQFYRFDTLSNRAFRVKWHTTNSSYIETFGIFNNSIFYTTVSWDIDNGKISLFLIPLDTDLSFGLGDIFSTEKVAGSGFGDKTIKKVFLRSLGKYGEENHDESCTKFSHIKFEGGKYLSATDSNDDGKKQFLNLANAMYPYETPIGYDYDSHNNNIDFDATEEIDYEYNKNTIYWSNLNSVSFPDTHLKRLNFNVKRILPAPAFLRDEYKNTLIIWGRNQISRFIIEGDPSGMAADTGNIIPEKSQYGLVADDSIQIIGNNVFWLSEEGIMLWNPDGIRCITKGIMDIPLVNIDEYFAYYIPLNNQYVLHWKRAEDDVGSVDGYEVSNDNDDNWYALGYREGDLIKDSGGDYHIIQKLDGTDMYLLESIEGASITIASVHRDYVYHIDSNKFTRFGGLEIKKSQFLSRSDQDENVNIFLTDDGNDDLVSYPDSDYTSMISLTTKEIETYWANYLNIDAEFEGDSAKIKTVIANPKTSDLTEDLQNITNFEPIYLSYNIGNKLRIYFKNIEETKTLFVEYIDRQKRNW